jgi:WD40 repeat protein
VSDGKAVMAIKGVSPSIYNGCERLAMVSASSDNQIVHWNISDHEQVSKTPFASDLICMTYLPQSKLIATGHEDGTVFLWHFDVGISLKVEHNRFVHTNTVTSLSVYNDSGKEYLLSAGYDAGVLVWEIIKQKFTKDFDEAKR